MSSSRIPESPLSPPKLPTRNRSRRCQAKQETNNPNMDVHTVSLDYPCTPKRRLRNTKKGGSNPCHEEDLNLSIVEVDEVQKEIDFMKTKIESSEDSEFILQCTSSMGTSVERANFIRNYINKSCTELIDQYKKGNKGHPQALTLVEELVGVANNFPRAFCQLRHKNNFETDDSSAAQVRECLEILITTIVATIFRLSCEMTRTLMARVAVKVLHILFGNSQLDFHWAVEIILSSTKQFLLSAENKPAVILNGYTVELPMPVEDINLLNLMHVLEVVHPYWHHMLNRCTRMAELYLELIAVIWKSIPNPDKFKLLTLFPIPLSKSSAMVEYHGARLFEIIIQDSLELLESAEFLTFCRRLEKYQFDIPSFESVAFSVKAHDVLTTFIHSVEFQASNLVLTKTALVRLWCKSMKYVHDRTLWSSADWDLSNEFLTAMARQFPMALPAFDLIIGRECLKNVRCLEGTVPDVNTKSTNFNIDGSVIEDLAKLDLSDDFVCREINVGEISNMWSIILSEWKRSVIEAKNADKSAYHRMLLLSKEVFQLADQVYRQFFHWRLKGHLVERVRSEDLFLIFFPFEYIQLWTKLIPKILQSEERNGDGMSASLNLIAQSLSSIPGLHYASFTTELRDIQRAWLMYLSWGITTSNGHPYLEWPERYLGGFDSWEFESIKKCDDVLENCVKAVMNPAVHALKQDQLVVFYDLMQNSKFRGCKMGILNMIGNYHILIKDYRSWKLLVKFVERTIREEPWQHDDQLTLALTKALIHLPCIINSSVDLEGIPQNYTNWRPTEHYRRSKLLCSDCDNYFKPSSKSVERAFAPESFSKVFFSLIQPFVLHCNNVEAKFEMLNILRALSSHGAKPHPGMVALFLYHLKEPQYGFVEKLVKALIKYLDYRYDNDEQYSSEHLQALGILFGALTIHIRNLRTHGGHKDLVRLFGNCDLASTTDWRLKVELVKIGMNVVLISKSNTAIAVSRKLLAVLAEENGCSPKTIIFAVRYEIIKCIVDWCLSTFFGTEPIPFPVEPPRKGKRGRRERPIDDFNILSEEENRMLTPCNGFLDRIAVIGECETFEFTQYYVPLFLAEVLPLIKKDKRALLFIHALAAFACTTAKGILIEYFPIYFPMLINEQTAEVVNDVMAVINEQGIEADLSSKNIFLGLYQTLTNEMLSHLSTNKLPILRHFNLLQLWTEESAYYPPVEDVPMDKLLKMLAPRLMGFYIHVDVKLHCKMESWKSKRKILASFVELLKIIGPKGLEPTVMKVFSTLKSFFEIGKQIEKVLFEAWLAFAQCLPVNVLPLLIRQILAALVCRVPDNREAKTTLNEMIRYFTKNHANILKAAELRLYFLADYIVEYKIDSTLTRSASGYNLFYIVLSDLTCNFPGLQILALKKLDMLLHGVYREFDLNVFFAGSEELQPLLCKLILGLMETTRSTNEEIRMLGGQCIGLIGAIDNYRSMFKTLSDAQTTGRNDYNVALPSFGARYLEQLQSQLQVATQNQDFDHIAFCIQEVLKLYDVKLDSEDPVWKVLSKETKVIMAPLLKSKYTITVITPNIVFPSPIYGSEYGKTYHSWATNWMLQMIDLMKDGPDATKLFKLSRSVIERNVKIAAFLLPYLTIRAILDCPSIKLKIISDEIEALTKTGIIYPMGDFLPDSNSFDKFEAELPSEMEGEVDMSNVEAMDRVLCTNAVLSVTDCLRRYTLLASYAPDESDKDRLDAASVEKMKSVILNYDDLSHAAFKIGSYQSALSYIETYLNMYPSKVHSTLPYLQRIYLALRDVDSIGALYKLRDCRPVLIESVMDSLAGGRMVEASYLLENMTKEQPDECVLRQALIQSYLDLDQPEKAYDLVVSYEEQMPHSQTFLDSCRVEACMRLWKWDEVEQLLTSAKRNRIKRWSFTLAGILAPLQRGELSLACTSMREARAQVINPLALASLEADAYHKLHGEVVRLHILCEIEQAIHLMMGEFTNFSGVEWTQADYDRVSPKVAELLASWEQRLGGCQSLKVLDPILNVRQTLIKIVKELTVKHSWTQPILDDGLRTTWLHIAKAERKRGNHTRVKNCLDALRVLRSPKVEYEEAKFLHSCGETDSAIYILHKCLSSRSEDIDKWESSDGAKDPERLLFSKISLLFAIYNDKQGNVGNKENIINYTNALKLNKESEKNYFHLAFCHNRILESMESGQQQPDEEFILTGIPAILKNYCESLRYGSKFIFHSLPRLLSVWLDGTWKPLLLQSVIGGLKASELKAAELCRKMNGIIRNLRKSVPPFIFFTAFSQLISRLCHSDNGIWVELKEILAHMVCNFPHQAIWMMVGVTHSSYPQRRKRCEEIFRLAETRNPKLKALLPNYNKFGEKLIKISGSCHTGKYTTMKTLSPDFSALVAKTNLSIMLPFKRCLNCILPRSSGTTDHKNVDIFPQELLYIQTVMDEVEVMSSLQKPKRLTFRCSDGKLYSILLKPQDDLRKDSKVMEMNHVLNWYLAKDPEASQRQLHIRTYAVVPLNETCGIIEWVPKLLTLRGIAFDMYKKKGISKDFICQQMRMEPSDSLTKKVKTYEESIKIYRPVIPEWFFTAFPDPRVWYFARENFTRTVAVMSVFGYLMGLGDRHGENILLDARNGEIVHVDFNCIFNLGDLFRWPEQVPFRLTHNIVANMGVVGFEGAFRYSCEITLRVLRAHQTAFTSVLVPFIFDPLLEWKRKPTELFAGTGEMNSEKGKEHLTNFIKRLEGRKRNLKKDTDLPFSVEAQVNYLIAEATKHENLAQMYCGWSPYI